MSDKKFSLRKWVFLLFLAILVSIGAFVSGVFNYELWKEEALQYDGSAIVVERYEKYGWLSGIRGFDKIIHRQSLTFTLPGSAKRIVWSDEYADDLQHSNFNVLALHVVNNEAFVVTEPAQCISYNKWNRPNPPYVLFKFNEFAWQQITLSQLPDQIKHINLSVGKKSQTLPRNPSNGIVSSEAVASQNMALNGEEYGSILRVPMLKNIEKGCPLMHRVQGQWMGNSDDFPLAIQKVVPEARGSSKKN